MASGLVGWGEVVDTLGSLRVAVKEARRRDGLTLRDLAERSGVSFNSISRFERGRDIYLSHAVALMEWLARPSVVSEGSQ